MLQYSMPYLGMYCVKLTHFLGGSGTSNVKTSCRKLCPANLVQVSSLICGPYSKVQLGHCIEKALYFPYYCFLDFESFFFFFVVRLPAFLLNPRQEINAVAVVLLTDASLLLIISQLHCRK